MYKIRKYIPAFTKACPDERAGFFQAMYEITKVYVSLVHIR